MNTRELLIKLAGNDRQKQLRAEQWTTLIWSIGCELTEAQGKVLLNEPCPDEDAGTLGVLEYAIKLREPVFLQNAVELLWNTDNLCLCLVLDVLNDAAQRQLLKTPDAFMNLLPIINGAEQYRESLVPYDRWMPAGGIEINSIYRAAWYILDAYGGDYLATVTERYSLKKLKAVLKVPERIDRYSKIAHVEYDYSTGYLHIVKTMVECANIPEFEPIWFKTSEDIADEGHRMENCMAGYWKRHGISCCVFACIYKGTRFDIEVNGQSLTVAQCFEWANGSSDKTHELFILLQTALNPTFVLKFTYINADEKVFLYDEFGFGELKYKCVRYSAITRENNVYGRYLVSMDASKVFRIAEVDKRTMSMLDVSTLDEGRAVSKLFCETNGIPTEEDIDTDFVFLFEDFDLDD